jgi:hypothetical protein
MAGSASWGDPGIVARNPRSVRAGADRDTQLQHPGDGRGPLCRLGAIAGHEVFSLERHPSTRFSSISISGSIMDFYGSLIVVSFHVILIFSIIECSEYSLGKIFSAGAVTVPFLQTFGINDRSRSSDRDLLSGKIISKLVVSDKGRSCSVVR